MNKVSSKISVVIPTYNSWKTIKDCLDSINRQSVKPREVIVVDNASSDGTGENVKKHFPEVKLVSLNKNTGVSGGRNAGIKAARDYDYIFFFDHDMVAEKEMLRQMLKVANSGEQMGIVTPKIFYWEDRKRVWAAGTGINLWTGQVIFRGGKDRGQFDTDMEVQVAPAALFVKRQVIDKLKGFEEKYFATYEDTDFCFRAKSLGFKTYYAAKAIAWHKIPLESKSEAVRLLSRSYYVAKNRILFMKDFGKSYFVFLLFLPIYALFYLRLALRYNKFKDWTSYLKGTFDGLTFK